jgi:anti-anti-sigma factor
MGIQQWSDNIIVADLADDPLLSDDLDALMDRLAGRCDCDVLLDFANVSYVNSSNLALLLRLRKHQLGRNRKLRLCGLNQAVQAVFSVTGLEALFDFDQQVATALAQMQLDQDRPPGASRPNSPARPS